MPETFPLVREFYMSYAAVAAGADLETPVCVAPWAGVISEVTFMARSTLTGANTDSRTLQLFNRGAAGSGTTKPAEKAFISGVNATGADETAVTLSATAADLVVAAGDVLTFKSLHVGSTGLADPGGAVKVKLTRS